MLTSYSRAREQCEELVLSHGSASSRCDEVTRHIYTLCTVLTVILHRALRGSSDYHHSLTAIDVCCHLLAKSWLCIDSSAVLFYDHRDQVTPPILYGDCNTHRSSMCSMIEDVKTSGNPPSVHMSEQLHLGNDDNARKDYAHAPIAKGMSLVTVPATFSTHHLESTDLIRLADGCTFPVPGTPYTRGPLVI